MTLTPKKQEQLTAFLASLPTAAALRLFAALEADRAPGKDVGAMGLPHDELIAELRREILERGGALPTRQPNAKRLFFTPVEDYFVSRRSGQKTRARIARTSLQPIWRLMMTDPACREAALAAAALDDALTGGGSDEQLSALFTAAEAGLGRVIAHAREDEAYRTTVIDVLGGAPAFDDLQEIRLVLPGVEFLKKLQALAPDPAASLSEEQIVNLRDLFLSAYDQSKLIGGYVLLALKGRLEQPWRALGVYYHLARGADERLINAKDTVDLLPESLFEDLETMARALEKAAERDLDARAARLRILYFADYADGLMDEAKRIGDNVFMNRIEACREVAGDALERFAEQALAAMRAAMPVRQAGGSSRLASLRPDFAQSLSPAVVKTAEESASLAAAGPSLAERLSRDEAFAISIARQAREEIHTYAKDLVMEIRAAEGLPRKAARRMLDQTLLVAEPLLASDEVALLRDRAAAAAIAV